MIVRKLPLEGALVIEPRVHRDPRGHFFESWHERRYAEAGIPSAFVQDNVSVSRRGVLRGLHFQNPKPQAKLVSVLQGVVWDVAVDARVGSETFGRWAGEELSAANGRQMYVPEGFLHGFVVLSEQATVHYKCTDFYFPESEGTVLWNDPELGISWPVRDPLISDKDRRGHLLRDVPAERLPRWRRDAGRDETT